MTQSEFPTPLLQDSFEKATDVGGQYSQIYFFKDIWIPRPKTYGNKYGENIPEGHDAHEFYVNDEGHFEYKYENVGMLPDEMAEVYMTIYGYNMLSVPITEPDILTMKMKSIFKLNLGKYMKWLDTMGYAYNPLWNVDGSESFQFIDNHGNIVRDNVPILQFKEQLKTSAYDGELKDTTATYNAYGGINKNGNNEQYTVSDGSAQSVSELRSRDTETHEDITGQTPQEIEGTIIPITGGDFSHIEKRVRQGNIGVTMTTQLIQAERELVKFNLIQEFFNDINNQLLVGIYPGF